MTSFIQNMIWNSVSGFVEEGKRTVGGYAGDALIKAGDMVEGGGRSVGNGIERRATGLGSSISGQKYSPSAKALPSTARRPAAHRSNSLPANSKPGGSSVPLGAKKTPAAGTAKKQVSPAVKNAVSSVTKTGGSALGSAKSTAGGLSKPLGGITNTANTAAKRTTGNPLPKPFPQTNSSLPKPYPQSGPTNLAKPYGKSDAYPSSKKTAVRPGQSKPFTPPKEDFTKKPYPGTNRLPGQASKTPVKKYKPMQRYEPPVKTGEVKHLAV